MKIIQRIILNMLLAAILFFSIMQTFLEGDYSELNINNSLFISGFTIAAFGLLTATNAGKLFRGFGYVAKKFFTRRYVDMSYYEYVQMKELSQSREKTTGWYAVFVGLSMIIVSFLLGY